MPCSAEKTLREAAFHPKVKVCWLLSGTNLLLVTVIGIPPLPFWLIPGMIFISCYLARLLRIEQQLGDNCNGVPDHNSRFPD